MANERTKCPLTDDQIKHMVNRFLAWKLPEDFTPYAGISFKPFCPPSSPSWPIGTNLFTATMAEAMIRYMVDGIQHGGVCLWCGFSATKGSLDELADAIYAHLGECDASPVPALKSDLDAALAQVGMLREALSGYGRHIQSIPELEVIGCDFDPEEGTACTCGLVEALSNTSATAQQFVENVRREALEKAWERFVAANDKREICTCDFDGKDAKLNRARAAILGEKGPE